MIRILLKPIQEIPVTPNDLVESLSFAGKLGRLECRVQIWRHRLSDLGFRAWVWTENLRVAAVCLSRVLKPTGVRKADCTY